jgi:hypothetical protein
MLPATLSGQLASLAIPAALVAVVLLLRMRRKDEFARDIERERTASFVALVEKYPNSTVDIAALIRPSMLTEREQELKKAKKRA